MESSIKKDTNIFLGRFAFCLVQCIMIRISTVCITHRIGLVRYRLLGVRRCFVFITHTLNLIGTSSSVVALWFADCGLLWRFCDFVRKLDARLCALSIWHRLDQFESQTLSEANFIVKLAYCNKRTNRDVWKRDPTIKDLYDLDGLSNTHSVSIADEPAVICPPNNQNQSDWWFASLDLLQFPFKNQRTKRLNWSVV